MHTDAAAPPFDQGSPPPQLVGHAFTAAPVVFYAGTWHDEVRLGYVSPSAGTVIGHPAASLHAAGTLDASIHPRDREGYRRALQAVLGGGSVSHTYRIVDAAGGYRRVRDQISLTPARGSVPPDVAGALVPVDPPTLASGDAPTSLLEDALENLPSGYAVVAEDGHILSCNRTHSELIGCPASEMMALSRDERLEILGRRVKSIDGIAIDGVEAYKAHYLPLLAAADGQGHEFELDNGTWKLVRVGRVGAARVVAHSDITRLKRTEAERERLHRTLSDALESIPNAFAIIDHQGRLTLCNSAFARPYGTSSTALIGSTPTERGAALLPSIARIDGLPVTGSEADLKRFVQLGTTAVRELEFHTGERLLVTVSPMSDGGSAIIRTDITSLKRAQEEREQMHRLLTEALESVPNDFAIMGPDGRLVLCNTAYAKVYGVTPQALMAMDREARADIFLPEIASVNGVPLPPDATTETTRPLRERLWESAPMEIELRNGQWKLITGSRLSDGGLAIIRTDVTGLKAAQHTLRESEARYRALVHHAPIVICELDPGGSVCAINAKGIELSPFHHESQVVGRHLRELVRQEDRQRIETLFRRAVAGTTVEFEHVIGRAPDSKIMATSLVPIRNASGTVERVVGIASDITAIREREDALRESEALVRQVLEGCPVPVRMSRLDDGQTLYENPANLDLYGQSPEGISLWAGNCCVTPGDQEPLVKTLREQASVEAFRIDLCCADGRCFPAEVSARLIEYHGEQVVVATTVDLTEKMALQDEMSRQREAMHQSEKLSALGELLASVAHELNNPLAVVVGQALMLQETTRDAGTAERAAKIGEAADRCGRIVKTFLAMARQKPGEPSPLDVNEMIEASLEVTAYALRTSGIRVSLELESRLPPVLGDASQLTQVITNLVVNAQHALAEVSEDRRLSISSAYRPHTRRVAIQVTDNGIGVPAAIRSRIFEPLFTTKEVGAGTGIGLAMCHRIIEGHGGTLCLENPSDRNGAGATFTILLPASHGDPVAVATSHETRDDVTALTVLVVDDEPNVAGMLAEVLSADGHRVETAYSGEEALTRLGQRSFDVVLSDLRMPGLDGPQLWDELCERRPDLCPRVVFVTGDTMSPSVADFLEHSGRPHLEKPVRPDEVRRMVLQVAGAGPGRGP